MELLFFIYVCIFKKTKASVFFFFFFKDYKDALQYVDTHYEITCNNKSCPEQVLKFIPEMKSFILVIFGCLEKD